MSGVGIDKFYFISQIPLFSELSWLERRVIASKAYLAEYKKGDTLYREGDPPDALYCLVTGRVAISTKRPDKSDEILEYLHRGRYFGTISLLTGEPHSVNARAINDSTVLKINKADFNFVLKFAPKLAIHMSQTISRRLKRKDIHHKTIFESTIISVYSPQAGTGCTMYAINLALSLARETKKESIFLDISPTGCVAAEVLGLKTKSGRVNLQKTGFDYRKIKKNIQKHKEGIDLLNISHDPDEKSDITHIAPLLTYLATDYHYIVTDLPPQMDQTVFKALTQSDVIHVIANPNRKMMEATSDLMDGLEKSIPEAVPKIKIIVNELKEKDRLSHKDQLHLLKKKVYGTLPAIRPRGQKMRSGGAPIVISQPKSEYSMMLRRIAREMGGVLIGLALGGGAALGMVHIGVLKVIEKEKIPVDIIIGSSMGSLIAALWAAGKSAEDIEKIAARFKKRSTVLHFIDPIFPRSGLIGGKMINRFLKRHLGKKTFHDVRLPIKLIACDMARRKAVILDEGRLVDAVRASIAVPGILRPVRYGEKILTDGGVIEPVPVGSLIQMGVKKIIAVSPLPSPEDMSDKLEKESQAVKEAMGKPFIEAPVGYILCRVKIFMKKTFLPNIFDVIVNTLQGLEYAISEVACQQADVVIHPRMSDVNWYDFSDSDKLIELGQQETEKFLPDIKKLLEEAE